jgi:hypothetical protein
MFRININNEPCAGSQIEVVSWFWPAYEPAPKRGENAVTLVPCGRDFFMAGVQQ